MKRSLFVIVLVLITLTGYGCQSIKTNPPVAKTEQTTTEPSSQQPEVPTQTPTQTPTEPTTEVTEPSTAPEATEPVTEPTPPTEEPDSTKPANPSEPIKPSENTKPATPIKPGEATTPPETEPSNHGFVEMNSKTYYYNEDGSIHTGWLTLEGDRYYFFEDGSMAIGKVAVPDAGTRYFTSTGKECTLVNPWNYVPDDYSVKLSKYGDYKVAKICLDDLKDMIADCKSAGRKAVVVSAYRSHSYQEGLYERRIQRFVDQGYDYDTAVVEAGKRVAVPGTSEHELGLAVDIVDVNYQTLDKKQEDTAAQKWLMENSWKYGFILRYPNEKSDVTGIIYEPWHYRYVGKELAEELHDSGLCLEEYFDSLT